MPSNIKEDEQSNDSEPDWDINEKPVKIDKWDGAAVKNALDDQAKKVLLDGLGYQECTRLMDGRLLICTVSVGFSLFALAWDYLYPFPASRPALIVCVVSYFIMMGVLTLYTTYVERGSFLMALQKDAAGVDPDNTWRLTSTLKKYDDVYTLTVLVKDGQSGALRQTQFTRSVAAFFDENGRLCPDLFEPEVRRLHDSISTDKKTN